MSIGRWLAAFVAVAALLGHICAADDDSDEAFFLDGVHGGLAARAGGAAVPAWASSADFSVALWFRPEAKAMDDHEEQCLLSHGSWEGRFKLSVLPWRALRFTVRDTSGGVSDCDAQHAPLRPGRWVHLAASWDASAGGSAASSSNDNARLLLNGAAVQLRCSHPPAPRRGGRSGVSPRPANPSRGPLLVGQCGEGGGATERPRGTIADLRYWPRAASVASVQANLFSRRLGPAGNAGWAELTRPRGGGTRVTRGGGGGGGAAAPRRSVVATNGGGGGGLEELEVLGGGVGAWVEARRGDMILSVTLTGRPAGTDDY